MKIEDCQKERSWGGIVCGDCNACKGIKEVLKKCEMNWEEWQGHCYVSYSLMKKKNEALRRELEYRISGNLPHKFVTLNFPSDQTEEELKECIKKLKVYRVEYLNKAKFCVEKYTDKGFHHHIHMIVYGKVKDSRIKRDLAKKFCNGHQPAIDVNNRSDLYDRHIDYVNGVKQDKKQENIDKDKAWRIKAGINSSYMHVP